MLLFAAVLFLSTAYLAVPAPFPTALAYQGFLLVLLLALVAALFRLRQALPKAKQGRTPLVIVVLWLPISFLAFFFHRHIALGRGDSAPSILAYAAALLLTASLAWPMWQRGQKDPRWLLGLGLLCCLAFQVAGLLSFPLGQFSDLLHLVASAGQSLIQGASPYGIQAVVPGGERTTYLPGLWLSYLPFAALGLDLRLANLLFYTAFACLAFQALPKKGRQRGGLLLLLFLANPWLALRHDLYMPALLAMASLWFWSLARGRETLAASVLGFCIASSQLFWPVVPLWLAWEVGNSGWKSAGRQLTWALAVAVALVLPFAIWDGPGMLEGVLTGWQGKVELQHLNLYSWVPSMLALPIQALIVGAVAWKLSEGGSLGKLFWLSSLALGGFLLFSFHASHYFYFLWAAFLLFSIAWPEPSA